MNKLTKFIIGAGALIGIYFISTAGKLKKLIIKVGDITKFTFRLAKPSSLFFNVYVTNPNTKAVTFNEFYGVLKFNGAVISTINKKQEITLPGKGATTSLSNIEALVSALELAEKLFTKGTKILTLDGKLTANGMDFPINEQMELKV